MVQEGSRPPWVMAPGFQPVTVDYKTNSQMKPPHSYAKLICMAMRSMPGGKASLAAIYDWIQSNFAYFKYADCSWQVDYSDILNFISHRK